MSVNVPSPQRQNTGSSPKPASAVVSRPRVRYPVTIMELLHHAFEIGASDLHIGASMPPLFRVDGELKEGPFPLLTGDHTELLLSEVVSQENRSRLLEEKELDIGFDLPGRCRLRGNVFFEQGRWAGVFRIIPPFIRTLDELGAPKIFKAMMKRHKGMILFTGPTGSGKSTSLAAMIDYINRLKNIHILTIEDPVEFIHNPVKARITHRELGKDTLSFSEGLKRALRQDPDVILVGEMRDLETIQLAIMAAETGHLVLSTLHTSSAAKSIHRIIDVFPTDQQSQIRMTLSENLIAIIAQSLVPHSTGTGRVAAYEIMVNTSAVANLIREEKVFQIPSVIETQSQFGMISMDQSLMKLVETGSISVKEALLRATETKIMRDRLIKMGYIENPQTLQQDGISDTLKSGDN
ncbi:MAG: twitching motility protein PilT [Candidatus Wallbacteria bacterium HGW-Wallbacteria-1]|uniref:Twitching motility protein PilT n=1 Tax=Candidatus Wallbacteria bacterium HGW-Wallbacteria-1 TaxID=2013854 RepID=A0A2N1PT91_9BACT|nr:MAG: twitching motility protein PilT [Candidatus Wallbacteria bacterium HGW-Wallbacteria-1]